MRAQANAYSRRWFEFFHIAIDESRTIRETEFICSCAPLPDFRKVIDVCCGMGRHARALSDRGYSVVGIDRDAGVIAKARELHGGPKYVVNDIRDYRLEADAFDAAIVMGQSFGYFDPAINRDVLSRLTSGVREGGRIVLDLWNCEFFVAHEGERDLNTPNGTVRERKHVDGNRLFVHLYYPDGGHERFEWQLFTPAQMISLGRSIGLELLFSCTDFDPANPPCAAKPRIQFVLERCS
jgi:SAM-dependent methyltransferase